MRRASVLAFASVLLLAGAPVSSARALTTCSGWSLSANVVSLWGGARHGLVLMSDGTVWDWGANFNGLLGNGTMMDERHTPLQVHGPGNAGFLTAMSGVMGGELHNFALKSDGTVWSWGWNGFGQLGDGTLTNSNVPVQASGLNGVLAITGGYNFSLALMSDHTLRSWGSNTYGQLGDGTTSDRPLSVPVLGLTSVAAVPRAGSTWWPPAPTVRCGPGVTTATASWATARPLRSHSPSRCPA